MKTFKQFLADGWFSEPKSKKLDRQPITADERELIKSVFPTGHNADIKRGSEYVLPENVMVNYKVANINFYKDGEQLIASIGWYRDEDGPGNPRQSPVTHTEVKIDSKEDLEKLKSKIDGK